MFVQLARLVVQCRQSYACRASANALTQPSNDIETLWPWRAEIEHESLELVATEVPMPPKDSHVEILFERDLPRLERADRLFMTILKVFAVETKLPHRLSALLTVPTVG